MINTTAVLRNATENLDNGVGHLSQAIHIDDWTGAGQHPSFQLKELEQKNLLEKGKLREVLGARSSPRVACSELNFA
jgi:hypothetical protein